MKRYYQPELTEKFLEENEDFHSFFVFRSKKLAEKVFPDSKILSYKDDDIEGVEYVDKHYPLHQINLKPLDELISNKLGFNICFYDKVKKDGFGEHFRVDLNTTNIVTQTGIFKHVFEYAEIGNHSGGVMNSEGDVWFNLHIYYKHLKGGSNGVKLGDAWYNAKTQIWKVVFVDE